MSILFPGRMKKPITFITNNTDATSFDLPQSQFLFLIEVRVGSESSYVLAHQTLKNNFGQLNSFFPACLSSSIHRRAVNKVRELVGRSNVSGRRISGDIS